MIGASMVISNDPNIISIHLRHPTAQCTLQWNYMFANRNEKRENHFYRVNENEQRSGIDRLSNVKFVVFLFEKWPLKLVCDLSWNIIWLKFLILNLRHLLQFVVGWCRMSCFRSLLFFLLSVDALDLRLLCHCLDVVQIRFRCSHALKTHFHFRALKMVSQHLRS